MTNMGYKGTKMKLAGTNEGLVWTYMDPLDEYWVKYEACRDQYGHVWINLGPEGD